MLQPSVETLSRRPESRLKSEKLKERRAYFLQKEWVFVDECKQKDVPQENAQEFSFEGLFTWTLKSDNFFSSTVSITRMSSLTVTITNDGSMSKKRSQEGSFCSQGILGFCFWEFFLLLSHTLCFWLLFEKGVPLMQTSINICSCTNVKICTHAFLESFVLFSRLP